MTEKELGDASMADYAIVDRTVKGWHHWVRLAKTSRMTVMERRVVAVVEKGGAAQIG